MHREDSIELKGLNIRVVMDGDISIVDTKVNTALGARFELCAIFRSEAANHVYPLATLFTRRPFR